MANEPYPPLVKPRSERTFEATDEERIKYVIEELNDILDSYVPVPPDTLHRADGIPVPLYSLIERIVARIGGNLERR